MDRRRVMAEGKVREVRAATVKEEVREKVRAKVKAKTASANSSTLQTTRVFARMETSALGHIRDSRRG